MKSFLIAAFLLTSSSVFATPTVGDFADYDIAITQSGIDYKGDYSLELLTFDAVAKSYQEREIDTFNGAPETKVQTVLAAAVYSEDFITDILTNCVLAYNGVHENITTAAGTFDACKATQKFSDRVATQWIAHVPFGIIKDVQIMTNGDTQTSVLKSFKAGKN